MAYGISNEPFERRCPPPKRRKPERLTRSDRLVLALGGGILGMILWSAAYAIVALIALRVGLKIGVVPPPPPGAGPETSPFDCLPAYGSGGWVALGFAGYGSLVGPERMMDGFEWLMRRLGDFAEATGDD